MTDNTTGPKDWTKVMMTCPKCGKQKPVIPDFGLSALGEDAPAPQMPCNKCRIAFVTSFL